MKRGLLMASAALVLAAGSIGMAGAAPTSGGSQKGTNASAVPGTPVSATGGVSGFNAAMEIAEVGRQQKDPLILVAAARAVLAIGSTPGEDAAKEGAADKAKPAATTTGPATKVAGASKPLVDRLLADATTYARGDQAMLGYIRETEAGAGRGTTAGPHRHNVELRAGRYIDYTERFVGGQLAEAAVVGDGDTDVDVAIYDQNGNRVCASTRGGDREYCSWTPAWTGNFTVRVTNYGRVYNNLALLVN